MAETMTTTTPAVRTAPVGRVNGELRLNYPTRGYAVTRNPFAIWSVLPSIVLAFVALGVAELVGDYSVYVGGDTLRLVDVTVAAFLVVTLGLLLIPAVALKGSINLTHDGVTFERGKHHLTAGWDQIDGLANRRDAGLCLMVRNPQMTTETMKLPGGFYADKTMAQIPLRYFGDRQYSIIYDVRDRVPEANWQPALAETKHRSSRSIQFVYGATALICALAIIAVAIAVY
jgi:hypothetical protein